MSSRMAVERAAGSAQEGSGGNALPTNRFICSFPDCDATFNKAWRLDVHLCRHTGQVSRVGRCWAAGAAAQGSRSGPAVRFVGLRCGAPCRGGGLSRPLGGLGQPAAHLGVPRTRRRWLGRV